MTDSSGRNEKRPTIRDVAALAGVSISTVSHVFSGSRPISEATQERVRAAASELKYLADPSAQHLRLAKTGIIGLILRPKDAISGTLRGTETFQRLLGSIATHALERRRGLIHVPDVLDPTAANVAMDACIVAHPYTNDEVVSELRSRGVPIVLIDADPAHQDLPWAVNIDHSVSVFALLDAMHHAGRRRITYISGTEENNWNRASIAAYRDWCQQRGITVDHHSVFEGSSLEGAQNLTRELLARPEPPDAILTAPSTFARGVLMVASEMGIPVPDRLVIAALTDSELTRVSSPPVTSLDLRMEDAGAEAVRLAIELADGQPAPDSPSIVTPLIRWRASLPQP